MRVRRWVVGSATLAVGLTMPGVAATPEAGELAPILHSQTEPGSWRTEMIASTTPSVKTVDGDPSDWIGTPSRLAGTMAYSAGEAIYSDHLFDAYGGDDGEDIARERLLAPVRDGLPQTYRVEPLLQADVPGELGAPNPYPAEEYYGDAGLQAKADLVEVRIAADSDSVFVLARTSAMNQPDDTALLVLADTGESVPFNGTVPFGAMVSSYQADTALFLGDGVGLSVDSAGVSAPIDVVADPAGYRNTIEAAIPRSLISRPDGTLRISIAAGLRDPLRPTSFKPLAVGASLANIAFRFDEPVRIWFEQAQATALSDIGAASGKIDDFMTELDLSSMTGGLEAEVVPERGYFEKIFLSSPAISNEGGTEGIFQHYGIYLPPNYETAVTPLPLSWWFHWRGGKANSAATVVPRVLRDLGDELGGLVVSPRGRGTSTWYLGKGMVDYQEVWADVFASLPGRIDRDRVYVSGHSMGGWASYLMPILYPDRFAASFPVSPPVTQGAWTGLDFPNCDNYAYGEYTFCYVKANDSNPRVQHTRGLLENLRNTPIAIYAGGIDELVPITGEIRQAERLTQLGYRHRLYIFPTYEHYSPPIIDEWMEGSRYFAATRRDPNPARVTYVRDMAFERSVEIGPSQFKNPVSGIDFDFDSAFWMRGLTPTDMVTGRASVDARTLQRRDPSAIAIPEAGGPSGIGQTGPFAMTGLVWLDDPLGSFTPSNGFTATLTGARRVEFSTARMGLDLGSSITGTVTTDAPLSLRLTGAWASAPTVALDGSFVASTLSGDVLTIEVPVGTHTIRLG